MKEKQIERVITDKNFKSNNYDDMRNIEKHIEEIANVLYESDNKRNIVICGIEAVAEDIYNAGYRKQEWISVDERLPTNEGKYLVCTSKGKIYVENFVDYYGNGKRLCFCNYIVTHWMPLPEPPKGE